MMRLGTLLSSIAAAPAANAAIRDGVVPVEAVGNQLTPWLALASIAMVAMLFAAHWLVARGGRR